MGINRLRLILDAESLGPQADHKDSCGITSDSKRITKRFDVVNELIAFKAKTLGIKQRKSVQNAEYKWYLQYCRCHLFRCISVVSGCYTAQFKKIVSRLISRMRMFHSAVEYLEQVDRSGHNGTLRYKKVIPR